VLVGGLFARAPGLLAFATEENGLEFGLGPLGLDEQPPFKDAEKGVRACPSSEFLGQAAA
jgi:hypothetical protein